MREIWSDHGCPIPILSLIWGRKNSHGVGVGVGLEWANQDETGWRYFSILKETQSCVY